MAHWVHNGKVISVGQGLGDLFIEPENIAEQVDIITAVHIGSNQLFSLPLFNLTCHGL